MFYVGYYRFVKTRLGIELPFLAFASHYGHAFVIRRVITLFAMITEERLKFILRAERETMLSELKSILDSRRGHEDKKMTAKEAASYLGISLSGLYKKVSMLPHRRFGKKLVFVMSELHSFDWASLAEKKEFISQTIPAGA